MSIYEIFAKHEIADELMKISNCWMCIQRYSGGAVEGMNLKAKLTMRKAYGFKSLASLEIYHYTWKIAVAE